MYEYIPNELKKLSNWVCWQAVPDEAGGKIKKLPINPHTGELARPTIRPHGRISIRL